MFGKILSFFVKPVDAAELEVVELYRLRFDENEAWYRGFARRRENLEGTLPGNAKKGRPR